MHLIDEYERLFIRIVLNLCLLGMGTLSATCSG
jgi:hypothetical protein